MSWETRIVSEANSEQDQWTAFYFSLANPRGPGMDSVPDLLRRVASELERLGDVAVLDLWPQAEPDIARRSRRASMVIPPPGGEG